MNAKRWMLILVLLSGSLAAFLWIAAQGEEYANFPPAAHGPWVAFGDSLTEGFGAAEGQDYPSMLSRRLGVPIVNMGRSGDTTTDGLRRIDDAIRLRPRVVLLCLGGNDSLNGERAEVTFGNLATMIDRFHDAGSFVVLIGVHSASLRDKKAEGFARLAKEKHTFYVPDILQGVLFDPGLMADAVHPNEEGYKRIAERMEELLRPLMKELRIPGAVP